MKKFLNTLLKRIKETKILLILIILISISGLYLTKKIINMSDINEYVYNVFVQGSGRTPQITKGESISQVFTTDLNHFTKIGIFAVMPGISTNSTINVKLIETKTNKEIINQDVYIGELVSDNYLDFSFESQEKSKNKEYELIITGIDGDELNSVQFLLSDYPNQLLGDCKVGDETLNNNVMIKAYYNSLYPTVKLFIVSACIGLIVISLILLNDKDVILNHLCLNKKQILLNLKNNWYWIIPIISYLLLSIRVTLFECYFIPIIIIFDFIILTQVSSIKDKIVKVNNIIKAYGFVSTIGTAYYVRSLFLKMYSGSPLDTIVSKFIVFDQDMLDKISFILMIGAGFIIYAISLIILNYIFNKIKDVFTDLTKSEKVMYVILLGILFIYVIYAFTNSNAFYGHDKIIFDLLFTSDSGRLVTNENAYLSIYHGENDLRQPLFGLFAMPFIGFGYTISLALPFIKSIMPISINLVQIILFFIANLMIAKLLNLKPIERIAFMFIIFSTYMSLLFAVMMEQYIVAYFWLISFIYAACYNKQDEVGLSACGGTLLTSLALTPFILNDFSIKKYKEYLLKFINAGLVFIIILISINRIDLLENMFVRYQTFNSAISHTMTIQERLQEYTEFIKCCIFKPTTYVSTEMLFCPASLQRTPNTGFSIIGISIIILAFLGYILNRKDKLSIISFYWSIFSFVIICIVGWGTSENGTILYSLYFGWPFVVLICKLFQSIFKYIKFKYTNFIVLCIILVLLIYVNGQGVKELLNFAITNYKV